MSDPYAVLEIPRTATSEEARRAYRRKAMKVHPDRGGSVEEFQRVKKAFESIIDPISRAKIDNELVGGTARVMTEEYASTRAARADVGGICSLCGGEKVIRVAGSIFWTRKPCPKCQKEEKKS